MDFINTNENTELLKMDTNDLNILLNLLNEYDLELRDNLNLNKNITFGIEIESEFADIINIENEIELNGLKNTWQLKDDYTLDNGIEISSPILKDDSKTYLIPFGSKLKVREGDVLEAGDQITEGSKNPAEILAISGPEGVYEYIIGEVQKVYRNQGVDINDKHIEVIGRQMLKRVRVEDNGDTGLFAGSLVDINELEEENEKMIAEGKKPATYKRVLLGITKASLATESFLSAASFQETTRVLTEAAVKGKVDELIGLKENVIIGKLIPAGTGMKKYRNVHISTEQEPKTEQNAEVNAENIAKPEKS